MNDTQVTTIIITAVSVSNFSAHDTSSVPDWIQCSTVMVVAFPSMATSLKIRAEQAAEMPNNVQVTSCAPRSPMKRPKKPATIEPSSGRKTAATNCIADYPLSWLISSTAMVPRLRKKTTTIARPMAASAAATVRMNMAKICPTRSFR